MARARRTAKVEIIDHFTLSHLIFLICGNLLPLIPSTLMLQPTVRIGHASQTHNRDLEAIDNGFCPVCIEQQNWQIYPPGLDPTADEHMT